MGRQGTTTDRIDVLLRERGYEKHGGPNKQTMQTFFARTGINKSYWHKLRAKGEYPDDVLERIAIELGSNVHYLKTGERFPPLTEEQADAWARSWGIAYEMALRLGRQADLDFIRQTTEAIVEQERKGAK